MAFHPETEVLLYNGSIKKVEQLNIDDLLIGEDSQPRRIIEMSGVLAESVTVVTNRNYQFVVSNGQELYLRKSPYLNRPYFNVKLNRFKNRFRRYRDVEFIPAGILIKKGSSFRRSFLLYKTATSYPFRTIEIDPYFLGLWLGDGHSHLPAITTMDAEIENYVAEIAKGEKLALRKYKKRGNRACTLVLVNHDNRYGFQPNRLTLKLRTLQLINDKHIPIEYLINDRNTRLQLLAGIIDTDGYLGHNYYSITQKSERLANDICQLANSLGFYSIVKRISKSIKRIGFSGTYFEVIVCGRITDIPVRVPRKVPKNLSGKYDRKSIGYKLTQGPLCHMIRLRVSGNGLFLLGNGTIIPCDKSRPKPRFKMKCDSRLLA